MTDGDQIFITTNKNIVSLRSKSREFYIPEDIASKPILLECSVDNFKKYFNNNLKLNKVGIFSNQMTVLGDLSAHIQNLNQFVGLPIAMLKSLEIAAFKANVALTEVSNYGYSFKSYVLSEQKELLRMKDFSQIFNEIKIKYKNETKTLKDVINIEIFNSITNKVNVLKLLSSEDFEKFKVAVHEYCEASRNILSSLQMQEIDSAKTGMPVDLHKYPFLSNTQDCKIHGKTIKLSYRPTWFLYLRGMKLTTPGAYVSTSIPGIIFNRINEQEKRLLNSLDKSLDKNGNKIESKRIIVNSLANDFPEYNNYIKILADEYAKERIKLKEEKTTLLNQTSNVDEIDNIEQVFKTRVFEVGQKYNKALHVLMNKYDIPLDVVTNLCYNISLESASQFYKRGFMLNIWKNEFLIYLASKSENKNIELKKVKLYDEFNYDIYNNEEIEVLDNHIFKAGQDIGKINIINGTYIMSTINNRTFIIYEKEQKKKDDVINSTSLTIKYHQGSENEIENEMKEVSVIYCKSMTLDNKTVTGIYNAQNKHFIGSLINYGFKPQLEDNYYKINTKIINKRSCKIDIMRTTKITTTNIEDNNNYFVNKITEENKNLYDNKKISIDVETFVNNLNIIDSINCNPIISTSSKNAILNSDIFYIKDSDKAKKFVEKLNKKYIIV